MFRFIILATTFVMCLNAGSLSIGLLGGAPLSDVAKTTAVGAVQSIPKSTNFTIGPALQINLPANLRIEADALFRPYSVNLGFSGGTVQVKGQQWRFPVLMQYRFGGAAIVHPFVGAGMSFGHLSGLSTAAKSITSGPGQLLHQSDASPVVGGGLDVGLPLVRISAEIRFTRLSVSNIASFSNNNQAEVLLGIHF